VWFQFQPARFTIAAAATPVVAFSLNAAALALRPFTIVRTRGSWHCRSDQAGASEYYGGGLGMAVVSDQASAVGVTAVPTPITEMGSDLWFMYEVMTQRFEFVSGVGFEGTNGELIQFDSKAMRKVDIGQDMVVVLETNGAAASLDSFLGFRMLVKVH